MFDTRFFEKIVPNSISLMRENFEVSGEVGVVVHLAGGDALTVNAVIPAGDPSIVALACVFPSKKGDRSTRMTTVCVPVASIVRVDLTTHSNNPEVTGRQRKFAGYISQKAQD